MEQLLGRDDLTENVLCLLNERKDSESQRATAFA